MSSSTPRADHRDPLQRTPRPSSRKHHRGGICCALLLQIYDNFRVVERAEFRRVISDRGHTMDSLSLFGTLAVTAMLVCYALEDRNRLFILGFAAACALGSIY